VSEFLSVREAAEYLHVEYKTIWRLVRRGELPAARIGNIYRIRKEDIDSLFASGVTSLAGAEEVPPMGLCAHCGAAIERELDLGGRCEVCAAPICSTCWLLEGRRRCLDHANVAAVPEPTRAARPSVSRCARCQRVLPASGGAGCCQAPGCSQVLCAECWSNESERFCLVHAPLRSQRLARAQSDLEAGRISRLVVSLDAKKTELAFIARFDQKIHHITTIRNPNDSTVYRMASWDNAHETSDQVQDLLDILKTGFLQQTLGDSLPMNLSSRYIVPHRQVPRGQGLVLEARCFSHLKAHASDGFDVTPAPLDELLPILQARAKEAEEGQRPYILGLASTVGWEARATEYIAASVSGHSYSHRYLLPCLIDLVGGELVYDQLNERIQPFVSLFSLRLEEEDVQRVLAYVRDYLMVNEGLPVAEIGPAVGVSDEIVQKAVGRLRDSGSHRVEQIKGSGAVLMRRSRQ